MKAILQGQKVSGLPEGGTVGQVLTKIESGSSWQNVPSDIFIAEYDVTTFNEVKNALDEGKYVFAKRGTAIYTLTLGASINPNMYVFHCISGNTQILQISLVSYGWAENNSAYLIAASARPLKAGMVPIDTQGLGIFAPTLPPWLPTLTTVTLASASWSSNSQTVSVSGILADSTAQNVQVSPKTSTDADNWGEAGIWCNESTVADQLTFTCKSVPSADIQVNISIQEAS